MCRLAASRLPVVPVTTATSASQTAARSGGAAAVIPAAAVAAGGRRPPPRRRRWPRLRRHSAAHRTGGGSTAVIPAAAPAALDSVPAAASVRVRAACGHVPPGGIPAAGRPGDDRHVDIPDCRSFRWRRRRHPGCRGCCWRSASAASAAPLAAPAPSSGCPSYRWRQHRRHPGGSFNAVVQIAKFDTPKPSYSECSRTARTAGWARTAPQRLDLWVLPATNRPREDEAPAGRFRKDLLCRLNVFGRDAPPLRDTCSSAVTVTVPDETGAERAAGCVGYELAADLDFGHQRGWTQRPAGAGTAHAGCPPRAGMIRRYDRSPRPTPTLHPHGRG